MSEAMNEKLKQFAQNGIGGKGGKPDQGNQQQTNTQQDTKTKGHEGSPQFYGRRRGGGLVIDSVLGDSSGGLKFDEVVVKAEELVKVANDRSDNIKFHVIKLLNTDWKIRYSGFLIVGTCKFKGIDYAGFNAVMVQSTAEDPTAMIFNVDKQFLIPQTPSMALDDYYMNTAAKALVTRINVKPENILVAGGTLLNREMPTNDEEALREFLGKVYDTVKAELILKVYGQSGASISDFSSVEGNNFSVQPIFNTSDSVFYDDAGMPIRSDIIMRLSAKTKSFNHNSLNEGNSNEHLVDVHCYVDFMYTTPQTATNPMLALVQGFGRQCLIPRIRITGFKPAPNSMLTENLVWQGITEILALSQDLDWAAGFIARSMSSVGKNADIDYNDIHNLNVIANLLDSPTGFGKPIDRTSKDYTHNTIPTMLRQAVVVPGIVVSIDVEEVSTTSSILKAFVAAKRSGEQGTAARNRIIRSLNALTDGRFGEYQGNIFEDQEIWSVGGYYKVGAQMRDIRHLNSLLGVTAYYMATAKGEDNITRWIATQQAKIHPEVRCSENYKMMREISNQTFVPKQMITTVTLDKNFYEYLRSVMTASGFNPMNENYNENVDLFAQRSFDVGNMIVSGGLGNGGVQYFADNNLTNSGLRDYNKKW